MSNRHYNAGRYLNDFDVNFRARDLIEPIRDAERNTVKDEKGEDILAIVARADPAIEVIDRLVGEIVDRTELTKKVPGIDNRFILYFRDVSYINPPFEQEKDDDAEFNMKSIFYAMQKLRGTRTLFEPTGIFYNQGECLLRIRTHHGDKLKAGDDVLFDVREIKMPLSELLNYKQQAHESQSKPYGPVAKVRVLPGIPAWYEWERGERKHKLENIAIRTEEFDDDALRAVIESFGWSIK